jgi:hypothetical protein
MKLQLDESTSQSKQRTAQAQRYRGRSQRAEVSKSVGKVKASSKKSYFKQRPRDLDLFIQLEHQLPKRP